MEVTPRVGGHDPVVHVEEAIAADVPEVARLRAAVWRAADPGIGGALLAATGGRLAALGFADAILSDVRRQPAVGQLFEWAGWRHDGGTGAWKISGQPLPEVRYRRRLSR